MVSLSVAFKKIYRRRFFLSLPFNKFTTDELKVCVKNGIDMDFPYIKFSMNEFEMVKQKSFFGVTVAIDANSVPNQKIKMEIRQLLTSTEWHATFSRVIYDKRFKCRGAFITCTMKKGKRAKTSYKAARKLWFAFIMYLFSGLLVCVSKSICFCFFRFVFLPLDCFSKASVTLMVLFL